ncbi:ABC transporter ATP-binding protein [Klebsiella pneumoniae]|uniref:ABC transporter ATP-binding protein n=1 Tax=Klebsiella pneumoniae TaxID=573 RepID=UPI00237BB822|nr:ABC transporter ATP-binding protein [Klebsiella pneumoniae]MDE1098499.1 ABC transporter ATP-binding protein [Klebsiella pneumoniae]HBZ4079485.1 ABC transporter ATP-binding protein [Klebsiella pneumoniae]
MADTLAVPIPALSLQGIDKYFGSFQALSNVTLDLLPGEVHCLLGENGAGKSTLCNVIFGVHQPDSGVMLRAGKPYPPTKPQDALLSGIAMVHQHFSLVDNVTVLDNLLLGQVKGWINADQQLQRIMQTLQSLGLDLNLQAIVSTLSVGERQRVEIVKCLLRQPSVLILDEPTAVLLPTEIDALLSVCERVAQQGCAVVLVTHKLAEIQRIASRATVLQSGRVVRTSAQPALEIDRLVRAMIDRPGQEHASAWTPEPNGPQAKRYALSEEVLQLNGLTVRDSLGVTRLDNCTLVVNRGEIVAIAGVEGNGQSELGAVLAGMQPVSNGKMYVAGKDLTGATPRQITLAGVGIVPEDRHALGCITDMSLLENLLLNHRERYARWGFLQRGKMREQAQALITLFDIRAAGMDVSFGGLSGGNQQKAVLARELTLDPLVLLMAAQPTRGLDVGAVAAVYRHITAARDRGVGVLLISSELDEVLAVADRVVVFYRGKIMGTSLYGQHDRAVIGAWMAGQAA